MKKELILDGLGCANCAAKIEDRVKKINYITEATLNFALKKLTVVYEGNDKTILINDVQKIADDIEPGIFVKEKGKTKIRRDLNQSTCTSGSCAIEDHSHEHSHDHSHSHDHDHSHDHSHNHEDSSYENNSKKAYLKFGISFLLFILGIALNLNPTVKLVVFLISYILVGYEVLLRAFKNILRGQIFDENFLMSIATIGAFIIGDYAEGVAVMLFYNVGEFFQEKAVDNSRKSIANLMDIRPDFVNLIINENNENQVVDPEDVKVGDKILIKPGEKVPLDSVVISGNSLIDTVALTGESVPRTVKAGDDLLSGSINKDGLLICQVKKEFGDSTVSKILDLVENATNKKSKTENFITKFSKYYTPFVVFSALIIAVVPPLVMGTPFSDWVYRALVFLVVSCPCALVVSVPLGYFGGLGAASKKGVLIKGGNYLEALQNVDTIVFDKTGTLTEGVFNVSKIETYNDFSEDEVLRLTAYAENYSSHPIGVSIKNKYGKDIVESQIKDYKDIAGHGISATIENKKVLVGNKKLMEKNNIKIESKNKEVGTVVYVSIDNKFSGLIVISDKIKADAKSAIKGLNDLGIKNTIMLTGDNKEIAEEIAEEIGINKVYSELLPNNKVDKIEEIINSQNKNSKTAFVGDGINDAPVLARADVGIAMGGLGSDAAIEAADVVLMTDEPSKIITAVKLSRFTQNVVVQNIVFALGVKALVLILSVFGFANMWLAVFADVGVTIIAIFNSMRILKFDN